MPWLTLTRDRGLHVDRYPPQPVCVLGITPTLAPSFLFAQAIFEPKFSRIITPSFSNLVILHSPSHVRRQKELQSKCLRLAAGAPWYVSNRQIHEDLGVPLFAYHIRALTASFDSNLSVCVEPPSTSIRQILTLTEG